MIPSAASTRSAPTKRRVITSCSECYRRKQKCDRARPCNFCTSRGVPGRCRYENSSRRPTKAFVHQHEHIRPQPISPQEHGLSMEPCLQLDVLDQMGYSRVSRHDQFESIGEDGLNPFQNDPPTEQAVGGRDADAYLKLVARLPPQSAINELIGSYFSDNNWSFQVLDEQRFRRLYDLFLSHCSGSIPPKAISPLPPVLSTVPALLFSILAVALQSTSMRTSAAHVLRISTYADSDRLSQRYKETGEDIIELYKQQKPTTTSIEYHLTKTLWLKNCGRGGEAWHTLGIAVRQAQEIDLHQVREDSVQGSGLGVEDTLVQLWELEHQKRLWARLFIMDSHMAMALGRPRSIHREDCTTTAPLDCDYPSDPSRAVPMSTKHSHQPPNGFSPVIFMIALGHKIHDMFSMRASKSDLKDHTKVQSLHQEVSSLVNELPRALRPSFPDTAWDHQIPELPALRERILTTASVFFLSLHRPYVATHISSRLAATEAAFDVLQAQHRLFELVHEPQRKLYSYSFYMIDAGIFLAAIVIKYSAYDISTSIRALQQLSQAIARLSLMKDRNMIARIGQRILQRCYHLIEASMQAPSRIASEIDFEVGDLSAEVASFLQDTGFRVPDEPAGEFISTLANPFTSARLPTDPVLAPNGPFGQDGGMPALLNDDEDNWYRTDFFASR